MRPTILVLAVVASVVLASEDLWSKVQATHGGKYLTQIKSYQEVAELAVSDHTTLTVVTKTLFKNHTIQIAYKDGNTLIRMAQYSDRPADNWQWDKQTGKAKLDAATAKEFKQGFERSWYGLRSNKQAKAAGQQTLRSVKGEALDNAAGTRYVVNPRGVVVAESYDDTVLLYSQPRCVQNGGSAILPQLPCRDGVLIPFAANIYVKGDLIAKAKVISATINPKLTAADFKAPK